MYRLEKHLFKKKLKLSDYFKSKYFFVSKNYIYNKFSNYFGIHRFFFYRPRFKYYYKDSYNILHDINNILKKEYKINKSYVLQNKQIKNFKEIPTIYNKIGYLYVNITNTNILANISDHSGKILVRGSSGALKYKGTYNKKDIFANENLGLDLSKKLLNKNSSIKYLIIKLSYLSQSYWIVKNMLDNFMKYGYKFIGEQIYVYKAHNGCKKKRAKRK